MQLLCKMQADRVCVRPPRLRPVAPSRQRLAGRRLRQLAPKRLEARRVDVGLRCTGGGPATKGAAGGLFGEGTGASCAAQALVRQLVRLCARTFVAREQRRGVVRRGVQAQQPDGRLLEGELVAAHAPGGGGGECHMHE